MGLVIFISQCDERRGTVIVMVRRHTTVLSHYIIKKNKESHWRGQNSGQARGDDAVEDNLTILPATVKFRALLSYLKLLCSIRQLSLSFNEYTIIPAVARSLMYAYASLQEPLGMSMVIDVRPVITITNGE